MVLCNFLLKESQLLLHVRYNGGKRRQKAKKCGPQDQKSTVAFPLFPGSVLVVLKLFNGSLSLAHFKIQTFKITKKTFHSSTFFMLHHYILKQHNPIVLCHVFPYYAIAISLIFNFIHSFTPKLNSHCS